MGGSLAGANGCLKTAVSDLRINLLNRFDCALSTSANSRLRNRRAHTGAVRNLSARTRGLAFIALVVLKIDRQMALSAGARHFNQFAFRILGTAAVRGFHNWCWRITARRHAQPCDRNKSTCRDKENPALDFHFREAHSTSCGRNSASTIGHSGMRSPLQREAMPIMTLARRLRSVIFRRISATWLNVSARTSLQV